MQEWAETLQKRLSAESLNSVFIALFTIDLFYKCIGRTMTPPCKYFQHDMSPQIKSNALKQGPCSG